MGVYYPVIIVIGLVTLIFITLAICCACRRKRGAPNDINAVENDSDEVDEEN
jgi:hypothetical protein